jgi:membrane associated rhomboid family serine protease
MSGLIGFLLRGGGGLIKDSAEILIGQALVRAVTQRLKGFLLFYAVIAMLALAALIFLYVLIYRVLSSRLDDISAAAILLGANLLLIGLMLAARAIFKPRRVVTTSPLAELIRSQVEQLGGEVKDKDLEAGLAIGAEIGHRLRKATPQIALAAAVLGLVIGIRPQVLGLFSRRDPPKKTDSKRR